MSDRCKRASISLSAKTYEQLHFLLAGKSVQRFVEESIKSCFDDTAALNHVLMRCRPMTYKHIARKKKNQKPKRRGKSDLPARLRQHGLTWERLEHMYRAQNGCCWICDQPFNNDFVIDHCHRTTKVRGLLCTYCNWGLGNFKDTVANLLRAVLYLDPHHEIAGLPFVLPVRQRQRQFTEIRRDLKFLRKTSSKITVRRNDDEALEQR